MSLSTAWVYFAALTFAIVALVFVFAGMSSRKSARSHERAEREIGHALPSAHRSRPQNQTEAPGSRIRR